MSELTTADHAAPAGRSQQLFTISADRGWGQRFGTAGQDLRDGFGLWRLAWALGMADIKLRYRGSLLGPFWLTLSTGIMIGSMGVLYAGLFHTDIHTYLPYLAASLILWNYLSLLVSDGCTCFTSSEALIKGMRMPFTVHALRSVFRNTIILAHNVVVIAVVFIAMHVQVTLYALMALPGLAVWLLDGFAISLLFGAFCARFRDVPQIIASVMQIAFFLTPVMWTADILAKGRPIAGALVRYNPFYYILELVRAPLLGAPLPVNHVLIALMISGVICSLAALGFTKTRGRLAYWM
jgi:lipopolysaccharide transport system permease protein